MTLDLWGGCGGFQGNEGWPARQFGVDSTPRRADPRFQYAWALGRPMEATMASGTAAVAVFDRREMNRRRAGFPTNGRSPCEVLLFFIVMMFANSPPIRRNVAKVRCGSATFKTGNHPASETAFPENEETGNP